MQVRCGNALEYESWIKAISEHHSFVAQKARASRPNSAQKITRAIEEEQAVEVVEVVEEEEAMMQEEMAILKEEGRILTEEMEILRDEVREEDALLNDGLGSLQDNVRERVQEAIISESLSSRMIPKEYTPTPSHGAVEVSHTRDKSIEISELRRESRARLHLAETLRQVRSRLMPYVAKYRSSCKGPTDSCGPTGVDHTAVHTALLHWISLEVLHCVSMAGLAQRARATLC